MSKLSVILALMVMLVAPLKSAYGQIVYGKPASGEIRMALTSWTETSNGQERTLSQLVVPLSTYVPLRDNLEARVYMANVTNTLEGSSSTHELKGMTDARIQVNGSMMDDRLLLSLGANLPTGKTKLDTTDELAVMQALSRNYISYPNRRLGQGLGLNFMVGVAANAGGFRLGASTLYHYSGEYEAYNGGSKFDPSDYFNISTSVQRMVGSALLMSNLEFTTYGDDKQDGLKAFNRGKQLSVRLGSIFKAGGMQWSTNVRYYVRDRFSIFDNSQEVLSQLRVYGNELLFVGRATWSSANKTWSMGPLFELRNIEANELDLGDAQTVGVGVQMDRRITESMNLHLTYKYLSGNADSDAIDLSGYQVLVDIGSVF